MQVLEKRLENATIELQINLPVDRVEDEYISVFDKIIKNAKIDGFRKGKAPKSLIEQRFNDQAEREVMENLIRSGYIDAITEKKHAPISDPSFDFKKVIRGADFSFTAKFEVAPTIGLAEYKGLEADQRACQISEEDIGRELEKMRDEHAKISKKGDEESVENGNLIKIGIKRIDDVDAAKIDEVGYKEYSIIIGRSKDKYAIDKYIIGMKLNEEKETEIKYPKDYEFKEYSGKNIKYKVKINEINNMDIPPLDDEFAKDVGEFNVLDDLKKNIRDYLEKHVEATARRETMEILIKMVVDKSTYDIPETMVKREKDVLFRKLQERTGYHAKDLKEFASIFGIQHEDFEKQISEEALFTVKSMLVRFEIAKRENIKCSEDEYNNIVAMLAERNGSTREQIEKDIRDRDLRENIEAEVILENALNFIYTNAKITRLKPVTLVEFSKGAGN